MPLSVTAKLSWIFPSGAGLADTAKRRPPRAVNFTALSTRFSTIARSRTGSPST